MEIEETTLLNEQVELCNELTDFLNKIADPMNEFKFESDEQERDYKYFNRLRFLEFCRAFSKYKLMNGITLKEGWQQKVYRDFFDKKLDSNMKFIYWCKSTKEIYENTGICM